MASFGDFCFNASCWNFCFSEARYEESLVNIWCVHVKATSCIEINIFSWWWI